MLKIPEHNPFYRYFSIDPGSNTMGLSIFEIDLLTQQLSVIETGTISGERLSRYDTDYIECHGNKTSRLIAQNQCLFNLLCKWNPQAVICESPYMGRFPQAYGVLVETITFLKQAVFQYDPFMPFELIDPSTAKKNINASIKGKDSVKDSLLKMLNKDFQYFGTKPFNQLDEHSYDSISIGYYKYKEILKSMR